MVVGRAVVPSRRCAGDCQASRRQHPANSILAGRDGNESPTKRMPVEGPQVTQRIAGDRPQGVRGERPDVIASLEPVSTTRARKAS